MPLFYSFFCTIYDLHYGLGADNNVIAKNFDQTNLETVQQSLYQLSQIIVGNDDKEETTVELTDSFSQFLKASKSSTDKMINRNKRHLILKEIITPLFT